MKVLPFPNKKYNIIYADPPWTYRKSGGIKSARGLAKKYYSTIDIEDIKSLPVQDISDHNCYLFLWVTAPCIQEGLDVLKAWGFKFFTITFTWVKTNKKSDTLFMGMGNATRANPEYVLLGRKGKLERKAKDVHSVLISKIEEHSKKPNRIRRRIELLYGNLPRIELFARPPKDRLFEDESFKGWDLWGDEV
jgi:N6-adenosine-specific RNA methylase IME4